MSTTKHRLPIFTTQQGKALDEKQKSFRLKTIINLAVNIAKKYPDWLAVRVWKAEKIPHYARLYVGGSNGYLVATPRGVSEYDIQTRGGKKTEVFTAEVLPWQLKEYRRYRDDLFAQVKDFVSSAMEDEQDQWDSLADKLGYEQAASTSMDVFQVFGIQEAVESTVDPNRAALEEAKRGDVVTVGKSKWVVFADHKRSGGMLSLYKFGSKGSKMYRAYIDGDAVVVRQIDGSANFVGPTQAQGRLSLTGERTQLG